MKHIESNECFRNEKNKINLEVGKGRRAEKYSTEVPYSLVLTIDY